MKKIILASIFILLFITGCSASVGLGAGSGNLSTSVSVEKQIKKDKKEVKKYKKSNEELNTKKKTTEKRVKQIREDAIDKTIDENQIKEEKNTISPNQRVKQVRN